MKCRKQMVCVLVLGLLMVSGALHAKPKGTLTGQVNINEATVTQLTVLPGVGIKTAEAIRAYAQSKGFKTVSELNAVKGIGPKSLAKLTPYIVLAGATTAKFERAAAVKK